MQGVNSYFLFLVGGSFLCIVKLSHYGNRQPKERNRKALYLKGIDTEKILELTGVCRQTLSRWVNKEGWKELRSAYGMTREELKKKLMAVASKAIDNP